MSKKLEEYGNKKSCAITAAKRLADLLGEQMVKEKGLACAYIISKYPTGTPVTERVIPAAIFNITDEAVKASFIRKWCKSQNSNGEDIDVRSLIDWDYYKDRLASVIQKIITIPACMQNVENPVPRIPNPAWLEKSLKQDSAASKQGKISDLFEKTSKESAIQDIENIGQKIAKTNLPPRVHKRYLHFLLKFNSIRIKGDDDGMIDEPKADDPQPQDEYESWLMDQKKTWRSQLETRKKKRVFFTNDNNTSSVVSRSSTTSKKGSKTAITGLVHQGTLNYRQQRQSLMKVLINNPLEIIQIAETDNAGEFVLWTLIDGSYLHPVNLKIHRRFYINSHIPDESNFGKKVMYHLPRSKSRYHLYEYNFDESDIKLNSKNLTMLSNGPEVEGVYETSVPSLFRAIVQLGNVCAVSAQAKKRIITNLNNTSRNSDKEKDWFSLDDLEMKETSSNRYLKVNNLKYVFFCS